MSWVVVDTDVVSFGLRSDSRAAAYDAVIADRNLSVSFMTAAELDCWALERNWGELQKARLSEYLQKSLIVPYDRRLGRCWAEVTVAAKRAGRPIECADAWTAATAVLHGVPLVTHNRNDYLGVPGLKLISI